MVLTLLGTAVQAVREAMQERRERAEQAWRAARECALGCVSAASSAQLRQCSGTAHDAAELSQEVPEHGVLQLEARAALDELGAALESGNRQRVSSAIDRASSAGRALGWRMAQTR